MDTKSRTTCFLINFTYFVIKPLRTLQKQKTVKRNPGWVWGMKFVLSEMERARTTKSKKWVPLSWAMTALCHQWNRYVLGSRYVQSRNLFSRYAVLVFESFLGGTQNIYSSELLGKMAGTRKIPDEPGTSYRARKNKEVLQEWWEHIVKDTGDQFGEASIGHVQKYLSIKINNDKKNPPLNNKKKRIHEFILV